MLNEISAILNVGLLYLFSFFLGYIILFWARIKELFYLPFFIKLPIYLSLGLLSLTIILFIIGFVRISGHILVIIALFSFIIILYHHLKHGSEIGTKINFISLDNITPMILFIIVFLHFSTVVAILRWPPVGDVFEHGLFTSILVYNQKIRFTLAPHASLVPLAPLLTLSGLHVLSAALSMLTGIFPGEAVFIVGCAIVTLIPTMLYSLTYILTCSKLLSLLAFLSAFLIGPGLEQWVLGYFYNGPYPNLFGFLSILLFLICLIDNQVQVKRTSSMHKKELTLVIILGILIVYPAFAAFPLLYLLISALYKGNVSKIFENIIARRKSVLLFLTITVLFIALSIVNNQSPLPQILQVIILHLHKVYGRSGYAIYIPIFYTNIIGVSILISGIISIFFIVKHLHVKLALFYLIILIPVMFSLHPNLYPFFSLILPNRSLMICSLISYMLISAFLDHVFRDKHIFTQIKFKNHFYMIHPNLSKVIIIALIILLGFTPSLFSNFTFEQAHKYSWLMRHGFTNDYDVLLWVHKNIQLNELIMNDYSYVSRYLLSFSIKNVTSKYYFNSDYEWRRAMEVQEFWRKPNDINLFLKLVKDYNISYILVTSERGYENWVGIGGDNMYVTKPYAPAEYKAIFNNNPYLKLKFEKGDAGIYKVLTLGKIVHQNASKFDNIDNYVRLNTTNFSC
jgi:hypothetical protein